MQYKLIYLWPTYIMAAIIYWKIASANFRVYDPSSWVTALALLTMFCAALAGLELLSRHTPTRIRVQDGRISLYRLWLYAEFDIRNILYVETNVRRSFDLFMGNWTKVTVSMDGQNAEYYIDPNISSYVYLLKVLNRASEQNLTNHAIDSEEESFIIPRIHQCVLGFQSLGGIVIASLAIVVFHNDSVWIASAVVFLIAFTVSFIHIRVAPMRVDFMDCFISFKFLLGQRLTVRETDILNLDVRRTSGATISLAGNRKLWLLPYFNNYSRLSDRLNAVAKHGG